MDYAMIVSIIGQIFIVGGLIVLMVTFLEESDKWWCAVIVVLMGVVLVYLFGFWAIFVVAPPCPGGTC